MTKISLAELPEAFVSNAALTKSISRYVKNGQLRKLGSRLYTKNLIDALALIVARNLWSIVGGYFPGGLIADRTSLENKPTAQGLIFLISSQKGKIEIPGITYVPGEALGLYRQIYPL